jgi:hypothetical protein
MAPAASRSRCARVISTAAFSAPGQLRVATAATIVQASWDADRAPELEIELTGRQALSASDVLL